MAGRTFVLVIVDRDTGEFTIESHLSDDRPWSRGVVDAQKAGRNVRCFSLGDMTPDAAVTEWRAAHCGQRVAAGSIVAWAGVSAALRRGHLRARITLPERWMRLSRRLIRW